MRTHRSPQRGKARKSVSVPLSVKLPPKKVREKFLIIYELEGCKKAVNYLTKYYRVRRMRIILNGKRVRKTWVAWYLENQACFKKEGLTKRIVLHELYHHLIEVRSLELPVRTEEKEANAYARCFFNN
jgi:hypothetical protein